MTLDASALNGYTVRDDDDDDPELIIQPTGEVVDTWRENYPYDERMKREEYEEQKRLPADRAAEAAELAQGHRPAARDPVRGP